MATKIESQPAQPLEITSLRGEIRTRPPRSRRALGVTAVAVLAAAGAIVAAEQASDVSIGPGRVLVCALVIAWGAAAMFVAMHRPQEPLSWIMVGGAAVGAVAALAAEALGGSGSHDPASAVLALSLSLLVSIGLHLALGLPHGALVQFRLADNSALADVLLVQLKLRFDQSENHAFWS